MEKKHTHVAVTPNWITHKVLVNVGQHDKLIRKTMPFEFFNKTNISPTTYMCTITALSNLKIRKGTVSHTVVCSRCVRI